MNTIFDILLQTCLIVTGWWTEELQEKDIGDDDDDDDDLSTQRNAINLTRETTNGIAATINKYCY